MEGEAIPLRFGLRRFGLTRHPCRKIAAQVVVSDFLTRRRVAPWWLGMDHVAQFPGGKLSVDRVDLIKQFARLRVVHGEVDRAWMGNGV